MDERLEELIRLTPLRYDTHQTAEFRHKELKKFAEFILKEAVKFYEDNSGYNEYNNVWFPDPDDLLEYFGIKNEN